MVMASLMGADAINCPQSAFPLLSGAGGLRSTLPANWLAKDPPALKRCCALHSLGARGVLIHLFSRPSPRTDTLTIAMRPSRIRCVGVAAAAALTALVTVGAAPSLASPVPVCTNNQPPGTLCLAVGAPPDPVAYSTVDGNSSFISYHAVATNSSR